MRMLNLLKQHSRLGHIQKDRMNRLLKEAHIRSPNKVNLLTYQSSLLEETHSKPFPKAFRATHPSDLIHYDICGHINVKARHGTFTSLLLLMILLCLSHYFEDLTVSNY